MDMFNFNFIEDSTVYEFSISKSNLIHFQKIAKAIPELFLSHSDVLGIKYNHRNFTGKVNNIPVTITQVLILSETVFTMNFVNQEGFTFTAVFTNTKTVSNSIPKKTHYKYSISVF